MGLKSKIAIQLWKVFGICFCCLYTSCSNNSFYEFDTDYTSYQIFCGENDIVRIVRTDGEGAGSLDLFNSRGVLAESIVLAQMEPLFMTKCQHNFIEINYVVAPSDLELFLPWFKTHKFNPTKIGNYRIKYSYIIDNNGGSTMNKNIDSLKVLKNDKTVKLFYKNTLIDKIPIHWLLVYPKYFSFYNAIDKATTFYNLSDSLLVKKYLNDLLSMYKK
ncbi:MAG: hypothetical protein ABIN97_11440 [Ginsengibacter sp.]